MNKTGTTGHPLKVAIVGAGPGGFYAAEALLSSGLEVEVDLLERLPVPYGLVRFGVAPDHFKLKSVSAVFARMTTDARLRYFGNVALGRDVSVDDLGALYHAVIVATGTDDDRRLDTPGETLPGVHAARDFVGWYNGLPECADRQFDLDCDSAVVIGQGNVAIDVCRILASPVDRLRGTDIAAHALDALARSRLRHIHLVGRRGPAQAKCTPKELRELGTLPGWQVRVDADDLSLNPASEQELAQPANAQVARNVDILRGFAGQPADGERCIHLHFLRAPVALHGAGRVSAVELAVQSLTGEANAQSATPTGERLQLEAGLVLRAVGYRGTALPGLPFDAARGTLPHRDGRITGDDGQWMSGWYTSGWIKRGPSGVIGTNKADSGDTVAALLADRAHWHAQRPGREGLQALLARQRCEVVSADGWRAIERAEIARGEALAKPAEKFVRVGDMLAAAAAAA